MGTIVQTESVLLIDNLNASFHSTGIIGDSKSKFSSLFGEEDSSRSFSSRNEEDDYSYSNSFSDRIFFDQGIRENVSVLDNSFFSIDHPVEFTKLSRTSITENGPILSKTLVKEEKGSEFTKFTEESNYLSNAIKGNKNFPLLFSESLNASDEHGESKPVAIPSEDKSKSVLYITEQSEPISYDLDLRVNFHPMTVISETVSAFSDTNIRHYQSPQESNPRSSKANVSIFGCTRSQYAHSDNSNILNTSNYQNVSNSDFLTHWSPNLWSRDGLSWNDFPNNNRSDNLFTNSKGNPLGKESKSSFTGSNDARSAVRSEERRFGNHKKTFKNETKDEIAQEKDDVVHLLRALAQRRGLVTPQSLSVPVYNANEFTKPGARVSQGLTDPNLKLGPNESYHGLQNAFRSKAFTTKQGRKGSERRMESNLSPRVDTTRDTFDSINLKDRKYSTLSNTNNRLIINEWSEMYTMNHNHLPPIDYQTEGKTYINHHSEFKVENAQRDVFPSLSHDHDRIWTSSENFVSYSSTHMTRSVSRGLPPQSPSVQNNHLQSNTKSDSLVRISNHGFHEPMMAYNNLMFNSSNFNFSNSNSMNANDASLLKMNSSSHSSLTACTSPFSRMHSFPSSQSNPCPSPRSHLSFRSDLSPYSNLSSPCSNLSPSPRSNRSASPRSNFSSPHSNSSPAYHDHHLLSPPSHSSPSEKEKRQRERVRGSKRFNKNGGESNSTPILGADLLKKGIGRSILNELCMKRGWPQPEYALVKEDGPAHLRRFTFCASVMADGVDVKSIGEPMPSRATAKDSSVLALMNHLKSSSLI